MLDTKPEWPAPPGTTHKLCSSCHLWFASRGLCECPTCLAKPTRKSKASASPFDPGFSEGGQRPARPLRSG